MKNQKLSIFSIRARQKKSEMDIHLDINGQSVIVESKPQISLLGVTIDQTLSFMIHAQNATSKGAQALCSLLYLRKGVNGIKPVIARRLAMSIIFAKMFWASQFWWLGSQSISRPLAAGYHKVASWITGLSTFTRVTKLPAVHISRLAGFHLHLLCNSSPLYFRFIGN
jgi:hypothetical protein